MPLTRALSRIHRVARYMALGVRIEWCPPRSVPVVIWEDA